MTQDDALFGCRLRLSDPAARTTVSNACWVFGVRRTGANRLALVAGYRVTYEPPRDPEPDPHVAETVTWPGCEALTDTRLRRIVAVP